MNKFNELFENALELIVEKNYATQYLLRRTLNISDDLALKLIQKLEWEGYISPADGIMRRFVEQKAFDHHLRKKSKNANSHQRNSYKSTSFNSTNEKSAFDTLGLKSSASKNEIESAYRTMAKMYHPDKVVGLAPEYMEIAERRMKDINIAYQKLKKLAP